PLIDGGTVRLPRLIGSGRAMDLVLTGRPVDAAEALRIGLVDRVVPTGQARAAAEQLAAELARLPQACLRSDRMSLLEQEGMDEAAALANEFRHGLTALSSGALEGARRFAAGAGRHGTATERAPRAGWSTLGSASSTRSSCAAIAGSARPMCCKDSGAPPTRSIPACCTACTPRCGPASWADGWSARGCRERGRPGGGMCGRIRCCWRAGR